MKKLVKIFALFGVIVMLCGATVYINNNLVKIDDSGNMTVAGDLTYALRHAELVGEDLSYTPNTVLNTWLKIAPGWSVTEADYMTAVADSVTIITSGGYEITFTVTFAAGNNEDYEVGLTKNGTVIRKIRRTGMGAGNYVGGQIYKYTDNLVAGDDIAVKIRNITNSNDPTIAGVYMFIRKLY